MARAAFLALVAAVAAAGSGPQQALVPAAENQTEMPSTNSTADFATAVADFTPANASAPTTAKAAPDTAVGQRSRTRLSHMGEVKLNVGLPQVTIPGIDNTGCLAMDVAAAMTGISSQLTGVSYFVSEFLNVGIFAGSIFVAATGAMYAKPAVATVAFIAGYQLGTVALAQYELFAANVNQMAVEACGVTKTMTAVKFDVSPCDFQLPYEPCYLPIVGAVAIGFLCMSIALCLVDWTVFFLGCALGVIVVGQAKNLALAFYPEYYAKITMQVPFWAISIGVALLGGLVAKWGEKFIWILATAAVGGFGASFSFTAAVAISGIPVPMIGEEFIFVAVAGAGACVQLFCCGKKDKEVEVKVEK